MLVQQQVTNVAHGGGATFCERAEASQVLVAVDSTLELWR